MIAIDTNILVRFLAKDDPAQSDAVYRLFKRAEANQEVLHVSIPVLMETIWVLESAYGFERSAITHALSQLLLIPILDFQMLPAIHDFLNAAQETAPDLSDLLIAHVGKTAGCDHTLTFDRKASRYPLFKLLK